MKQVMRIWEGGKIKKKEDKSMKSAIVLSVIFLALAGLNALPAEEYAEIAHVSYLEGELSITNRDGAVHEARLNFPVMPGDVLRSTAEGRGEIQFGNGSLVRLDKDSALLVGTIMAPTISTRWKITTLELQQGRIYVISNRYDQEILQVVTEETAVNFPRNANVEIALSPEEGTRVISHWGRINILYSDQDDRQNERDLRSKNSVLIEKQGGLNTLAYEQEGDFLLWNRAVDKNFKELHFGRSHVPRKITRNKALQTWAERWSGGPFGDWVYDKMFGYIWKPRGNYSSADQRPFFNAREATINGELFLIPDEPWGWAPKHMGTWVFIKKLGWVWIPGYRFSQGINYLGYWITSFWGGYGNYYDYLDVSVSRRRHPKDPKDPLDPKDPENPLDPEDPLNPEKGIKTSWNKIPRDVRDVLKKFEKSHAHKVKEYLQGQSIEPFKVMLAKNELHKTGTGVKNNSTEIIRESRVSQEGKTALLNETIMPGKIFLQLRHDWNPDRNWGKHSKTRIMYNSKNNSVIAPEKKLDSSTMTAKQRSTLMKSGNQWGSRSSSPGGSSGNISAGEGMSSGSSGSGSSSKSKD